MRPFVCPVDNALLSFEDLSCLSCHTEVVYDRPLRRMERAANAAVCTNREQIGCNWASAGGLCEACATTRVRPNDADIAGVAAWALTETAKRRLFYQLDDLHLPTGDVVFDLLSSREESVTTGHADGVITVDMAEGDDVHRESVRIGLGEAYRTMLGHLRHEIGHYYWQVLVDGTDFLAPSRRLFGDDREDYAHALEVHYAKPDDGAWRGQFLSRYAASHPWEDWAECFAHYLLITDTVQTAATWQVTIAGPVTQPLVNNLASLSSYPIDRPLAFDALISTWLPLSYALNAVNRSLGQEDAYPFVLSAPVLTKVRFVAEVVTSGTAV
ncbi:zinc-binding metallopeptidase family protein [Jatrophihabitans sp. YIM 134969]